MRSAVAVLLALATTCAWSAPLLPPSPAWTISLLDFVVEPQSEQCYYEDVTAGTAVEVSALVHRGGKLDVSLRIESPAGAVVYSKLLFSNVNDDTGALLGTIVKKGHAFVAASGGAYAICLDNRMARWTPKAVSLDVRVGPPGAGGSSALLARGAAIVKPAAPGADLPPGVAPGSATGSEGDEAAAVAHLAGMRNAASAALSRLHSISADAHYQRTRVNRHHETLVSTERRLARWSMLEITTVLFVAALEVLLVQRWFSEGDAAGSTSARASGRGGLASAGFGLAAPPPSASRMRMSV